MKIQIISPKKNPELGESIMDATSLRKLTKYKAATYPLSMTTLASLPSGNIEIILSDDNFLKLIQVASCE